MPLANFIPSQFRVHVFPSPSKRAREPQPSNFIIYSFDQGKRHKSLQFKHMKLMTITIWSDTLLHKLQSTGNLLKNLKSR